jgi:hypothetical protein
MMITETWIATLLDGTEVRVEWRTAPEQESRPESQRDWWQVYVDGNPVVNGGVRARLWGIRFAKAAALLPGCETYGPAAVVEWRREGTPSRKEMRVALEAVNEHATACCDRCSGYCEPMSDCADCGGTGTVAKAEEAFALVRSVLRLPK